MTDPHTLFLEELGVMVNRAQELCPPLAVALSVMLAAHYAGEMERFKLHCLKFAAELADEMIEEMREENRE
jgi:hypothetical protein